MPGKRTSIRAFRHIFLLRGFFVFFLFRLFVHFESPLPLFLSNPLFFLSFTLYEQSAHIDSWHGGAASAWAFAPMTSDRFSLLHSIPEP